MDQASRDDLTLNSRSSDDFLARDVIYTSRAYATMPVSVCLSVCDGSALAHYG